MSILASIAQAAEEGGHVVKELPMPTIMYGVIVFAILTVCAIVMFTFRDVANRHSEKAEAYAREHGAATQQGHGH